MPNYKLKAESGSFKTTVFPADFRIHKPLPDDHPAYATIGRATAEWARLEHTLDVIIWEMADIRNSVGSCITGQLVGHLPRFNVIGALGTFLGLNEGLLKEIEQLGNSISNLAKERNRIVHDAWFLESTTGRTAQFRSILPKKKKTFGPQDISDETVQELVSRIVKKCDAISELSTKIRTALQSSR